MRTYQTIIIFKSSLDEALIDSLSEKIKELISKFSGSIIKLENWGKKRLAYRIKKNRYGIYLNFCHTLEPTNVKGFENQLLLDENILKYLVIRLEPSEIEHVCREDSLSHGEDPQSESDNKKEVEKRMEKA